jgi:hypothetical protein
MTLGDGKNGDVWPVSMTMDETRKLVVGLLTALWTNDDDVAEEILFAKFQLDKGHFRWPMRD